jgi:hypothetical protein
MGIISWLLGVRKPVAFRQSSSVQRGDDGAFIARVELSGFPDKESALMAAGAMFNLVTIAREQHAAKPDEPAPFNPNVIAFTKGGR